MKLRNNRKSNICPYTRRSNHTRNLIRTSTQTSTITKTTTNTTTAPTTNTTTTTSTDTNHLHHTTTNSTTTTDNRPYIHTYRSRVGAIDNNPILVDDIAINTVLNTHTPIHHKRPTHMPAVGVVAGGERRARRDRGLALV